MILEGRTCVIVRVPDRTREHQQQGALVRRGMLKDAAGGAPGTTLQRPALRLHISPSHNCHHKHYFLSLKSVIVIY